MPAAYGDWLESRPWQAFASLSFRDAGITIDHAKASFATYMRRLEDKLRCPVAYFAALEHRDAIGTLHTIAPHWHAVLATAEPKRKALIDTATSSWNIHYGNGLIEPFRPGAGGCGYICKSSRSELDFMTSNMDRFATMPPSSMSAPAGAL
jgi:hypothetical protein